jgi:DNA repair exonuclease SbcCD ATPase subunit
VDFDESRTLIGGPNECGKSTLAEAIHRGFFLKAKGTTEHHRAMSSTHGGDPEVEIEFTTSGVDYRLKKRFGPRGSAALVPIGREALTGDEAETELARLLNARENIGRKDLPGQWSHIWVRQGFSGSDPAGEATAQQAPLLQRLQQIGGAVAVQSDLDAELAARFRSEKEKVYVNNGNAKAGSELAAAQSQSDEAATHKQAAAERLDRLTNAVRDFESSSREIVSAQSNLESVTKQKDEADTRFSQVETLRRQEAEQDRASKDAQAKLSEFETVDQRIAGLGGEFQTRTEKLAPLLEVSNELEQSAKRLRTTAGQSSSSLDTATESVRSVRQQRDWLAASVAQFQKSDELLQLQVRFEKIQTLQSELANFRQELARLPEVDDKSLEKLRSLETKVSNSAAAFNAMAAGLEVIASDQPIFAGQTSVEAGQSLVLTTDTEIRIGEAIRLQIRPGGGSSLNQARAEHQAAQESLRSLLEKIGIASVTAASETAARRNEWLTRIESAEQSLRNEDAASIPTKVGEAKDALVAAEAETQRRVLAVSGLAAPASAAEAKEQLVSVEVTLATAEQSESALKAVRDADAKAANEAEQHFTTRRDETEKERREVNALEIQLRTLEETHGNTASRAATLTQLRSLALSANEALGATQKSLADLNAEHAAADVSRLQRAIETTRGTITDAKARNAVAQNILRSDGSENPQSDLEFATARLETAQARLAAARRKAEAIRLLDQLFTEEQRSLATRFTQPLADKISGYLECLFGPGSRANVVFNDNEFQGLDLARSTHGGAAFRFETLSGGTKEQVAAAMRLAMAEILSEGFDGCLPVIFDDAFAYSDPDRVQILQRMLDLAAERGLQVIVLTCNPSDYMTLGAKQTTLAATKISSQQAAPAEIDRGGDGTSESSATASNEDRDLFLIALNAAGGSSGNIGLRQSLGWSEVAYDAVKQSLIDSGEIITGKGRGGSVTMSHSITSA